MYNDGYTKVYNIYGTNVQSNLDIIIYYTDSYK